MRTRVCKILKHLDAQAVENRVGVGMPDIAYIGGWIECKRTKAFPKRAGTPVVLDHGLLPSQKVWISRHARKGGIVHVLVQIADEFFLLDGDVAAEHLGEVDRATLDLISTLHCIGWAELEKHLTL